jgi:hypothetical protein
MKTKYRLQGVLWLLLCAGIGSGIQAKPLSDPKKVRKEAQTPCLRVRMGDSMLVEFHADHIVQAAMRVENAEGKIMCEHPLVLGAGANCFKLRFSEMPAGVYFIRVNHETVTMVLR